MTPRQTQQTQQPTAPAKDLNVRYEQYGGESVYEAARGILIMPVAGGDSDPPIQIRVHSPFGYRVNTVRASKHGAPPVLPAPCDTKSGDLLLETTMTVSTPQVSSNQDAFIYTAEVETRYLQTSLRGSGNDSVYQTPGHPYDLPIIDFYRENGGGPVSPPPGQGQGQVPPRGGTLVTQPVLSPFYFTYEPEYPGTFFSTDVSG